MNNNLIEKSDWLFKEIDIIFSAYKYNYTCEVWDEKTVELNKLIKSINNLSKNELMDLINYIIDYIEWYKNKDEYNSNGNDLFMYEKGFNIIKLIINNESDTPKTNDTIKDILEKI